MSIEERLSAAARAVEEMWKDPAATHRRLRQLQLRLAVGSEPTSTGSPSPVTGPPVDALRLIRAQRGALPGTEPEELVKQAQFILALTHEIATRLALLELPSVQRHVTDLANSTLTAGTRLEQRDSRAAVANVAPFSEASDVLAILAELTTLLQDAQIALVGAAAATEQEKPYWRMIEHIDAIHETNDNVQTVKRLLEANLGSESLV